MNQPSIQKIPFEFKITPRVFSVEFKKLEEKLKDHYSRVYYESLERFAERNGINEANADQVTLLEYAYRPGEQDIYFKGNLIGTIKVKFQGSNYSVLITPTNSIQAIVPVAPQRRNPWEIASAWYTVEGTHRCLIQNDRDCRTEIPTDHSSREFAEWMTEQYRLAMAKGIELGRSGELDNPEEKIP